MGEMIKIAKSENSYSAQIESVGLNFRWRDTAWTIAPNHPKLFRKDKPIWIRFFPQISLRLNFHTGSKGVWCWYYFSAFGFIRIRQYSREEFHPGYESD